MMQSIHTDIYDINIDGVGGYIENVNQRIEKQYPEYNERYGLIGSKKWLEMYAQGKISINIKCGQISYIGPDRCEPCEDENILEIKTDRGMISYDQNGYWCNPLVKLEAWVRIETVKIKIPEFGGPVTCLIDTKISILDHAT